MAIRKIISRSITDGAVVATDVAALSIDSTKLASNAVTNAKIASNAISSDKLDTNIQFGFKNRIINGDMRIDQRSAGGTATAGTTLYQGYLVDRWYLNKDTNTAGGLSISRSTTAPARFTNSLGITVSTGFTPATSENTFLMQPIEGFNIADFGWGTASAQAITLSFWVRSSLTGTFGGALRNASGGRSYPFSYTINAANTFEQKTITIAGDTTGTWDSGNTSGIRLSFDLGSGSTYRGTAGAWSSSQYIGASGTASVVGTTGATFYLTGCQLEVGSSATPFDTRPYGTEELLCKRYWTPVGVAYGYAMADGSTMQFTTAHPVMRADPSVVMLTSTPYAESPPNVTARYGTASSASNSEPNKLGQSFIRVTGFSGLTAYQPAKLQTNQVALNAEL